MAPLLAAALGRPYVGVIRGVKAGADAGTVVACKDAAECDRLWGKAEAYVRANATTLVRMTGKSILATAPAQDDAEYSLTLSTAARPRRHRCAAFPRSAVP